MKQSKTLYYKLLASLFCYLILATTAYGQMVFAKRSAAFIPKEGTADIWRFDNILALRAVARKDSGEPEEAIGQPKKTITLAAAEGLFHYQYQAVGLSIFGSRKQNMAYWHPGTAYSNARQYLQYGGILSARLKSTYALSVGYQYDRIQLEQDLPAPAEGTADTNSYNSTTLDVGVSMRAFSYLFFSGGWQQASTKLHSAGSTTSLGARNKFYGAGAFLIGSPSSFVMTLEGGALYAPALKVSSVNLSKAITYHGIITIGFVSILKGIGLMPASINGANLSYMYERATSTIEGATDLTKVGDAYIAYQLKTASTMSHQTHAIDLSLRTKHTTLSLGMTDEIINVDTFGKHKYTTYNATVGFLFR